MIHLKIFDSNWTNGLKSFEKTVELLIKTENDLSLCSIPFDYDNKPKYPDSLKSVRLTKSPRT